MLVPALFFSRVNEGYGDSPPMAGVASFVFLVGWLSREQCSTEGSWF